MPTLGAGSGTQQDDDDEGDVDGKRKRPAVRHSDVLEQAGSSEDEDEASEDEDGDRAASAGALATDPPSGSQQGPLLYERRDTLTGAPEPLAPELVTLSLLPKSQWQSLVHLETIKARNRSVGRSGGKGMGSVIY